MCTVVLEGCWGILVHHHFSPNLFSSTEITGGAGSQRAGQQIYAYFEANMSKQKSIVICKVMRVDIINLKPANSLRTWFREISWHFEKLKAPISVYFNCWFPLTTADSLWQWQTFPSISWGLIFAYLYQPGSEKEGLALQARSGFVWVAAWWPQGLLHPCLESRHLHRKGQIKST